MIELKINPYAGVFKRAKELFESGYYSEAFSKLSIIIENDKDNFIANYYVAECYFNGKGVEKNYDLAFMNYSLAADKKHLGSIYMLGYCFEFSLGTYKDDIQMISRYTNAAKSGHTLAQYRLGLCYKNGKGVEQSVSVASSYFLKAAKSGLVEAQREAGICFEMMNQPTASATLFLAAAEQKDPYSCFKIGNFYEVGYGCEQKYELAMHFYITAATLGNEDAILTIARKYKTGEGLEKSISSAINWWNKVIDTSVEAELEVAKCLLTGNGIAKDINKGMNLLKKAASKKDKEACVLLAKISLGTKTEEEVKEYISWLLKAAEYGSGEAMHLLGVYHEEKQNIKECYRWFNMAINEEYEPSMEAIKKYKKTLLGTIRQRKNA